MNLISEARANDSSTDVRYAASWSNMQSWPQCWRLVLYGSENQLTSYTCCDEALWLLMADLLCGFLPEAADVDRSIYSEQRIEVYLAMSYSR
jgi:hypothetical protein